jgi:hypothetical protein
MSHADPAHSALSTAVIADASLRVGVSARTAPASLVAERMRGGTSLRTQLDFAAYRARQAADPTLTLRRHLAERGGAIEV